MNVIAKISCYFERSVITLKLRKEYLNTVTYNMPVLLRIKCWTVWCIEHYSMSTYTGVSNFQKTVRFFGPPCILYASFFINVPGCGFLQLELAARIFAVVDCWGGRQTPKLTGSYQSRTCKANVYSIEGNWCSEYSIPCCLTFENSKSANCHYRF